MVDEKRIMGLSMTKKGSNKRNLSHTFRHDIYWDEGFKS